MKCPSCGQESKTAFSCSYCEALLAGPSEPLELDDAPPPARPVMRSLKLDPGSSEPLELDTSRAEPVIDPILPPDPQLAPEPFIPSPALERLDLPRWRIPGIAELGPKRVIGGVVIVATGVLLFFLYGVGNQQRHTAGSAGLMLLGGEVRPAMVITAESMIMLGRSAIDQVAAPDADRLHLLSVQRSRFEAMEEARSLRSIKLTPNDRPIMDGLTEVSRHIAAVLRALDANKPDEATEALKAAEAALVRVKELDATLPPSPPGDSDLGIDQLISPPPPPQPPKPPPLGR